MSSIHLSAVTHQLPLDARARIRVRYTKFISILGTIWKNRIIYLYDTYIINYNYISLSFIIHQIILSDEISDVNMAIYMAYTHIIWYFFWYILAIGKTWRCVELPKALTESFVSHPVVSKCRTSAGLFGILMQLPGRSDWTFFFNTKKHDFVVGKPCKLEEKMKFYEILVLYHPCLIKLGMACWVSLHGFPL